MKDSFMYDGADNTSCFAILVFILIILFFLMCGCNADRYDNHIVKDINTGKYYLLKHHIGDNYRIHDVDTLLIHNLKNE